ncbi:hypothetical protein Leryth_018579 [Lithospermum erythrorhizon]|nr:hypothetical protein Leryth_018579 [Lithospermum erythrorhizon]
MSINLSEERRGEERKRKKKIQAGEAGYMQRCLELGSSCCMCPVLQVGTSSLHIYKKDIKLKCHSHR